MLEKAELHTYRVRWVDEAGNVDALSPPILAPCDADAVQQAIALAKGDRVELWEGDRLVARFDPKSPHPIWERAPG